ncbi:TRAP transporter small permease [Rhodoligotrophos defluvii]|uniref:TRAP transporter small permease n=1 Tax=Rhodoligotrophos defluvii TaxID=2561934 RepID=UPI001960AF1B|nr:TRAP transporter small permease [Rhodoligotrophos defluvii]
MAGISLILMMLQVVADVLLINLGYGRIEGSLEIVSIYYMVAVVFLPLALVELRHEHISVDLVVQLLPKPLQRAVYIFACILSAIFFGVLGWQTLLDAVNSYRINELMMGAIYVTIWPARFLLPVGFFTLVLVMLAHAVRAVLEPAFQPVPDTPPPVD